MLWEFPATGALSDLTYHGNGEETYPDRSQAGFVGVHHTTVRETHVDYIVPGENGNRHQTRWLALQNPASGSGVAFAAPPGQTVDFGAHPYSIEDLDRAKEARQLRHDGGSVYLTLDHRQMGVGGDDSWSPSVHEAYRLPSGTYSWTTRLIPIPAGTERSEITRLILDTEQPAHYTEASFEPRAGISSPGWVRHIPAVLVSLVAMAGGWLYYNPGGS